jgi:hypothetical protein
MAIRKVNAITGRGCPEAQEASRDGQLPASGLHGTAATGGERDGIRQRNTSTPNADYLVPPRCGHLGRAGYRSMCSVGSHNQPRAGASPHRSRPDVRSDQPRRVHTDKKRMSGMPLRFLAAGAVQPAVDSPASAKAAGSLIFSIPDGCPAIAGCCPPSFRMITVRLRLTGSCFDLPPSGAVAGG